MITASDPNDILVSVLVYRPRVSKQMHWLGLSFFCIYSDSFDVYHMQSLRAPRLHFIAQNH